MWVYPSAYLPRLLSKKIREDDPFPSWNAVFVVGWTGKRGAISLAAALALPYALESGAEFPDRDLLIFITFFVILATLVVQGLSLPLIIRLLKLKEDGATAREEASARLEIYRAALKRIEEIEKADAAPPRMLDQLKKDYQHRADGIAEIVAEGENSCQDFFKKDRRLQLDILQSEREALLNLREKGALHENTVWRIQYDLDLEEQRLQNHNPSANEKKESA